MMVDRLRESLSTPFRFEHGMNKFLVTLFLLINGIVLLNAICHDPGVGYDSRSHLKYIEVLSEFRLPTPDDSSEFFSPPLPYLLPSLLHSFRIFDLRAAAKSSQLLNVLFSMGLTFYLIKICDIIRPNNAHLKITSLAFLGMQPVYYKTFAFVRGEPLLAFLCVLVVYKTLTVFVEDACSLSNIVVLGFSLGLLILARQWGFFLFPAIIIFVGILVLKQKQKWLPFLKATMVSLFVASVVGGWFYIHLYREYGTIRAFNRPPRPAFSFSNQPLDFYFGLGLDKLFSDPVRNSFPNQFFPIFYSEFWGDYWCDFIVFGRDVRNGRFVWGRELETNLSKDPPPLWLKTNRYGVRSYLGRVNLVSLFPSVVLLAGIVLGMAYFGRFVGNYFTSDRTTIYSLLHLVIAISIAGYFWFLIMYPSLKKGVTIKATYMLHLFPLLSILAGELLQRIKEKSIYVYQVILMLLAISTLHNLPVFITRYVVWPWRVNFA